MASNDFHIYLHFDVVVRHPHAASGLQLTLGEKPVPHTITVDTTNETATVSFVDDHGNATGQPANFGSIAFTSSDPSVLTVAADASNPLQGDLTPTGTPGTGITISADPLDASGAPLLEADGSTPFPTVTSEAIDVNPGAPAGEVLTVGPA